MRDLVLRVEDLHLRLHPDDSSSFRLEGIRLRVPRSRILGLVGETGSGKSLTALTIMGLLPRRARVERGRVLFHGENLLEVPESRLRRYRGNRIAMIFQDPGSALNPHLTVGEQIAEVVRTHRNASRHEAWAQAGHLLRQVGMLHPEQRLEQYPHHLSMGMCQRVMVAMALACHPELLLADEPTTNLDSLNQQQVLDLLQSSCLEMGTSMILISHDLGVVAGRAHDVAVMYAGRLLEYAPVRRLYRDPLHPYTRGLIASIPRLDAMGLEAPIPGSPADALAWIPGCPFRTRCPERFDACDRAPPWVPLPEEPPGMEGQQDPTGGYGAACWLHARPDPADSDTEEQG